MKLAVALALVVGAAAQSPRERAEALLAQMNTTEKLALFSGSCGEMGYVGNVCGNARLGVPPLKMNDGPQGFRDDRHLGTTTAWPAALSFAATWCANATRAWGAAMGAEFRAKGANVQLGPGVCVARVPQNGRNFEYVSGEDPFLGYTLVQPLVEGIQSQKVVANAKQCASRAAIIRPPSPRRALPKPRAPFGLSPSHKRRPLPLSLPPPPVPHPRRARAARAAGSRTIRRPTARP